MATMRWMTMVQKSAAATGKLMNKDPHCNHQNTLIMKSSGGARILFLLGAAACVAHAFAPTPIASRHAAVTTSAVLLAATKDANHDDAMNLNRRQVLIGTAGAMASTLLTSGAANAASSSSAESLIAELQLSLDKLKPVPSLLEKQEWEAVRTILKTPPVNNLWNLGDSKNTLMQLAKATDEFELIDIKDELSISLQICDQLTYDNVFVYYQPGMYDVC